MPVTLLDRKLVIAELDAGIVAMDNRCRHRSASLSLGWVEGNCIRCPYHGWLYNQDGRVVEIPSAPDIEIPEKVKVNRYDAEIRYDLVWVRLDPALNVNIPTLRSWDKHNMKCALGTPYEWNTSAPRRMENFFDLAHFAFVHDGTLGTREDPLVPIPKIDQLLGQLRWKYYPYNRFGSSANINYGKLTVPMDSSDYQVQLPFHVSLINSMKDETSNEIWMCASPLSRTRVKCFWYACRSEDLDGDDKNYTDIQELILSEDLPVVESQDPPDLPHPSMELSIPTDKVHVYYRKRLAELSQTYSDSGVKALEKKLHVQNIQSDEIHDEFLSET